MFCTHCGKELPDGSAFCNACGKSVAGQVSQPTIKAPAISIGRATVILSYILMLWLGFKEWVKVSSWVNDQTWTTLQLCEQIDRLEKLGITDDMGVIKFGAWMFLILNCIVILLAVIYLIKDILNYGNSEKINWAYGTTGGIIAMLGLLVIVSLITFDEGISCGTNVYFVLGIALLNRFVFLPKYSEEEYYRKKRQSAVGVRPDPSRLRRNDAAPVIPARGDSDWFCTNCGKGNIAAVASCQYCGKRKETL